MEALRQKERHAAEILAALLGAAPQPSDVPGADDQHRHDFDLALPDGRRIAVEVVSDTSEVDENFWAQIDRINPMVLEGQQGWQIDLRVPGKDSKDTRAATDTVRRIKAELPTLLAELDASGLCDAGRSLRVAAPRCGEHPLAVRLRELAVRSVWKADHYVTDEGKPKARFGRAGIGRSCGKSDIVDAANDALHKKRCRLKKARKTGADEVHLFVWLPMGQEHDNRNPGLSVAEWDEFDGDDASPELGEADKVWIAGWGFHSGGPRSDQIAWDMWSYSRAEGWCRHPAEGTPPLRQS